MPIMYAYWFAMDDATDSRDRVVIYAESKAEAVKKYEDFFGKKPGDLILRGRW